MASPADRVVLKVGNVKVTQKEFESSIGDFEKQSGEGGEGEGGGERPPDKNRRQQGEDFASVLALSQHAVATHLDQDPDIHHQLEIARLQVLSDAQFTKLMEQTKPTADEVNQYYAVHKADYDVAEIRRLFIWKKGEGSANSNGLSPQEARAQADKILQTYATGGDPQPLADQFKDSTNGLLDANPVVFTRNELPAKLDKLAFSMKEGEWSEVEDTPHSILLFHLVKLRHRQVGEVWSLVEREVQGQKMQAKLDQLKKNAGIWMDKDYFGNKSAPANAAKMPTTSARPTQQQPENYQEKNNGQERK